MRRVPAGAGTGGGGQAGIGDLSRRRGSPERSNGQSQRSLLDPISWVSGRSLLDPIGWVSAAFPSGSHPLGLGGVPFWIPSAGSWLRLGIGLFGKSQAAFMA